jgi:hypothetical protein
MFICQQGWDKGELRKTPRLGNTTLNMPNLIW